MTEQHILNSGRCDQGVRLSHGAGQALRTRLPSMMPTGIIVAILVATFVIVAGCGTSGGSSSGGSLTTYTSSDGTFSIGYPNGWQVTTDPGSTEFSGPASHENFIVSKRAASGLDPTEIINRLCSIPGAASLTTSFSSVTIGGQQWMRAECEFSNTKIHQAIEATSYQGNDFVITYEALDASFASDQSTYYMPMQQSFKF